MSSIIRSFLASVVAPHRYSVLLLGALLVLVSSFSNLLPSTSPNQNFQNAFSSPHSASYPYEQRQQKSTLYQQSTCKSPLILSMSSLVTTAVGTQDIRNIFSKYCDKDSLIDRKTLESMPPFEEMLADEELLPEELDKIWEAAPKSSDDASRVDAVSFAQIFRDVDDLFEDDEEDGDVDDGKKATDNSSNKVSTAKISTTDSDDNELDEELSKAYKSICDDKGFISKDKMMLWEEIQSMFAENLLGEDEFEELWKDAVENENGSIDASGFFTFNSKLDDLFTFDDDDDDETDADEPEKTSKTVSPPRAMVVEGDMPPAVLFSQLANKNYLVGVNELHLWTELKEMLDVDDLSESELQGMYDKLAKADSSGKLTEDSFLKLYDGIDALFEEVDDDEAEDVVAPPSPPQQQQQQSSPMNKRVKEDLLAFIDIIVEEGEEPCGLGATEDDQGQISNIVQVLEKQPTNMIVQKDGNIERADLAGSWELLYTSSSAMKFNNGLTGIGGSVPNGKFGGVRQLLTGTKYLSDFEYKERIEVIPSSASFDVTVNGIWDIQKSVSLFTGQSTIILNVEPDKVKYGLSSTRADHWKSLGPSNRLDVSYLDDDLRVMRGCTSSDTLFIFKRMIKLQIT